MVKQLPADEYIPAEVVERCPVCDSYECMAQEFVRYWNRLNLGSFTRDDVARVLRLEAP